MQREFSIRFRASELEARQCLLDVTTRLAAQGLHAETVQNVEIVLAEAINNIVEHAYAGVPEGHIDLQCYPVEAQLMICLQDTGQPLPQDQIPPAVLAPLSSERSDLPEGGFGWFLIQSLATAVRYERDDCHNTLFLMFDITDSR